MFYTFKLQTILLFAYLYKNRLGLTPLNIVFNSVEQTSKKSYLPLFKSSYRILSFFINSFLDKNCIINNIRIYCICQNTIDSNKHI